MGRCFEQVCRGCNGLLGTWAAEIKAATKVSLRLRARCISMHYWRASPTAEMPMLPSMCKCFFCQNVFICQSGGICPQHFISAPGLMVFHVVIVTAGRCTKQRNSPFFFHCPHVWSWTSVSTCINGFPSMHGQCSSSCAWSSCTPCPAEQTCCLQMLTFPSPSEVRSAIILSTSKSRSLRETNSYVCNRLKHNQICNQPKANLPISTHIIVFFIRVNSVDRWSRTLISGTKPATVSHQFSSPHCIVLMFPQVSTPNPQPPNNVHHPD